MENRKYYNLTNAQNVMYYALRYSPKKNITNIGTSLWINEEVNIDLFKEALNKSIKRVDALNLRLTEVDKQIKQYITNDEPKDTPVVDYSNKTIPEIEAEFDKLAQVGMKWKECELYDFLIAKLPNKGIALNMVINHVIVDAWGLTVFAKDVMNIYLALKNNTELPEAPSSFLEIIEEELKYNGSKRMEEDFEFWKNAFNRKPGYCAINPKDVGNDYRKLSLNFKSKPKIYTLPKEKVDDIKAYCKQVRLSPQILFLLAAQSYFAMLNNKDEVLIYNVLSRRSNMKQKKASGMMINILPLLINCPSNLTFEEACDKIAEKQFEAFRHGDYPYGQVVDYIWEKYRKNKLAKGSFCDMSLTYQLGNITTDEDIDFTVKYHSNSSSGIGIYLTIIDVGNKGTLDFIYEYKCNIVDEDLVRVMFCQMMKVIELGMNNPTLTLKEIMDVAKEIDVNKYEEVILSGQDQRVTV